MSHGLFRKFLYITTVKKSVTRPLRLGLCLGLCLGLGGWLLLFHFVVIVVVFVFFVFLDLFVVVVRLLGFLGDWAGGLFGCYSSRCIGRILKWIFYVLWIRRELTTGPTLANESEMSTN